MPISELTLLVAQHSLALLGGQQRVTLPKDDVEAVRD
jgi:hypothetical protein